jgi:oxygen-independent coproporphyrinogen-3 oxidase
MDRTAEGVLAEAGEEEYVMLRLRLSKGLNEAEFATHFGHPMPPIYRERASHLPQTLVIQDEHGIRLTQEGFLVSNEIITRLVL